MMNTNGRIEYAGYFPGAIGSVTALHAVYYHENWGFDQSFEVQVGTELSAFIGRFDPKKDGFWTVQINNEFAGAVAVDGLLADTEGARLRWFIVDPAFHKMGIGKKLMDKAVSFCRDLKTIPSMFLWTFKGLEAARRLYESAGFRLCQEEAVQQWGAVIQEQKFELIL